GSRGPVPRVVVVVVFRLQRRSVGGNLPDDLPRQTDDVGARVVREGDVGLQLVAGLADVAVGHHLGLVAVHVVAVGDVGLPRAAGAVVSVAVGAGEEGG